MIVKRSDAIVKYNSFHGAQVPSPELAQRAKAKKKKPTHLQPQKIKRIEMEKGGCIAV